MSKSNRLELAAVTLLGLALAMTGGCASNAQDRSAAAVSSLKDTRDKIAVYSTQVDLVLASLNSLQGATDLNAAFAKYSAQVDKSQADAADIKSRAADMRARGQEYVKKWQEEMSTITDPDLKAVADARRQAVQDKYAEIQTAADGIRQSYTAFDSDITGIRTYLANDLTPGGVTAAKSIIEKANTDGAKLKESIATVVAMMDKVTATMPAPPAPTTAQ
jgi:chromosome segregation ATPase